MQEIAENRFDPVLLAIMANRIEAIVREMTNTVVLTACSSVIGMARDFSCSVLDSRHELFASAEGLPFHIFGCTIQGREMAKRHPDFRQGDAFLHNDPYTGNTHAADHTILVPVFVDGEHVFTTAVKAHQADCGNSVPTTYNAAARDIYEEGALLFPFVRVQQDYADNDDIIAICRARIRIPEQWYGDYVAAIGAARTGERALQGFVRKFGLPVTRAFVTAWLDYSEQRAIAAIRGLKRARFEAGGQLDALGAILARPVPVRVVLQVDPEAAMVEVDLTDNPDCVDAGINQSEATATAAAVTAVFSCLDKDIPPNAGSFRRIRVHLRENCVVGIPRHPHSCSVSTTLLADVISNATQSAFAEFGDGFGLSEGNMCNSIGSSVISGHDTRNDEDRAYVNQMFLMGGGGPATPTHDGMNYYYSCGAAGLMYRDSIEVDEQRIPILIHSLKLLPGSGGAGRRRGGLATEVAFTARADPMTIINVCNGREHGPRGVQGGQPSQPGRNHVRLPDGGIVELDGASTWVLQPGQVIVGRDSGGGGYGDPMLREPQLVFEDVLEGWETAERARDVYGVALLIGEDGAAQGVDETGTAALRRR